MNLHLYTIFKFPYAILSNNGQHQNKRRLKMWCYILIQKGDSKVMHTEKNS